MYVLILLYCIVLHSYIWNVFFDLTFIYNDTGIVTFRSYCRCMRTFQEVKQEHATLKRKLESYFQVFLVVHVCIYTCIYIHTYMCMYTSRIFCYKLIVAFLVLIAASNTSSLTRPHKRARNEDNDAK